MDPIPLPDLVVCKICERQVSAKWLYAHSTLCKDAAELKELVLKQQSKLSQIVNKAYDLRNQLNTNFALQKLKMSRRPSNELDDSFELQRMPSSPAYIKKNKKYLHFNFVAEQSEGGRCGSQTPSPDKDCRRKKVGFSRRGSNEKLQEYEEEVNRAVGVLKSIIQYGNSAKLETIDVERDIANDFKIKNEVNVLYVAIKDKMISDYLQQFIENIQKYIKGKQTYLRKLEEVERQEYNTSSLKASDESFSSDNTRLQDLPTPFSLKTFKITSLDDSDVSEVCFERKNRLPDTRWMRRGSAGHPTPLKGPQVVTTEGGPRRNFTTLSKFASPLLRQGSNASQGSPQASPKSAGAMLNSKPKKGKIPQKLLDELIAMKEFHILRKPSRLLSSRLNLKGKTSADSDGGKKKDLKRNQTIHINPGNTSADCKTLAHIADEPAEESKVGTDAVKIYEMWKKRQSWNYVAKDIDIKKLLNKPDALEVCQEEEPPSGDNNNEAHDRQKQEENLLSKGDLTSSDESSSDDSSENNEDEEFEDSDDEFPTVPMRGYYSDSEVTNVRKGEQCKKTDVTIDDFNILKLLGEGAYGKVYLVKKKATGDMYAMKIVNFQDRESTHNKIASLRAESDVYKSITGDWVVKAYYTFSYESYVCFVMEYMLGGDLVGLLEQVGCFEESTAQFYFGELVLAVESLHCLGIVHRDLKPDNVLIDSTGHIKLTDFGLSEKGVVKLRQRTSTIRNSTLSSLTRNNSLHDSSEKIYNTITKELLSQLREDGGIGRKNSGEGLDPDLIPSPLTLRRIASTISELSPFHSEPYLVKNKNEEEVIFTFLANQERNDSWIPKKKIVRSSEHSNASNRKKELNRIIGTPDYMAPEIIKGSDCSDRSVDLWSLGVILYEFLVGVPPFNDDSMEKIFDNIVNLRFEWPSIGYEEDCITPEAADLIKKLMNPDPKKRITLSEVKKHAFFKNFEWDKVKSHQAPVIPMKKEVDCHTPMGLHTIFMEKMSEEMMREKRRKGIRNEDVSDFQMKRIDLLHQLNQSLYHAHILSKGTTLEKAP